MRDMVIRDTKDKFLHKILIETEDLDLDKIKMLYISHQINTEKIKEVYKEKANENKSDGKFGNKPANKTEVKNTEASQEAGSGQSLIKFNRCSCWRCGTRHQPKSCPAWNSRCNSCNELHHLTKRCPKTQGSNASKSTKTVSFFWK